MNKPKPTDEHLLRSRIAEEMADSRDEELEMELDDGRLDQFWPKSMNIRSRTRSTVSFISVNCCGFRANW